MRSWRVLAFLLLPFLVSDLRATDWPHWRGPTRDGHSPESSGWDGKSWLSGKPRWQARVGEGGSSPLVIGDQVITFGHESGQDVVRSLSLTDGKERWSVRFKAPLYGRFREGDEGLYSGPSSTPEYDPDLQFLYILGNDGDLRCLDLRAKGKQLWQRNLYDDYQVKKRPRLTRAGHRDYGYTTSPLVFRDWLLVEVGSTSRGTLLAFDKRTGKEIWASRAKDEAGHTGGIALMTVEGSIPCAVVLSQRHLLVIRLDPGHEGTTLASFPWVTDFANSVASPVVYRDSVLITSAYNQKALCRVRITRDGARQVWRVDHPSKVCTPVVHDGKIYVAWYRVRCLDFETGKLHWEGGGIGDAGSCIWTRDDRLIVFGLRGKLILVEGFARSATAYRELATLDHLFRTEVWPHVALSRRHLLCRDRKGNLSCFVLPTIQGSPTAP